ncbi:hypothetical protein JZ785_14325 [Alicyclobacillus curvatus]|nr:hypothetical protein JZ785_14325 [Alicyclobacillus curvatus]
MIISYRVPAEPSTARVKIWRMMKSMGALYIQQSVCLVPVTAETQKRKAQLEALVADNHGEVLLLEVEQLETASEAQMIALFNEHRQAEYKEFLDGCRAFKQEIETESQLAKFTFHEVEENEAELARLKRWQRKILRRDFFRCEHASMSQSKLEECETSLREFTQRVYQAEGRTEGELM